MRFAFVTCVQLGLSCMDEIYRVGGHLDLAVTLLDDQSQSKSGRVYLDAFCRDRGIPLVKTRHVNDPLVLDAIRSQEIDWLFVIGWSQIAGPEVLASPTRGVLGMHPTLLPEGRGRAAIPWAILKGLKRTGVTLFQLDEGVDTGPIVAQEVIELRPDETASTLYERVRKAHRTLIARTWSDLVADRVTPRPQDDRRASQWPGRCPEDGRVEPDVMTVEEIDRLVRAVTRPYPGAFLDEGELRVRVWAGSPSALDRASGNTYRIAARDGYYFATEFEYEARDAAVVDYRASEDPQDGRS